MITFSEEEVDIVGKNSYFTQTQIQNNRVTVGKANTTIAVLDLEQLESSHAFQNSINKAVLLKLMKLIFSK